VSLQKELGVAIELRSELTKAISGLQEDLAANRAVDAESLAPLIDQTVESLERNSDALMSLAHMSRRSQKLADHCFSTYCISMNLARFMGEDNDAQRNLGTAALLHEAGWLNIPLQLMGKRTRYTAQEEKLLRRVPELTLKKLESSQLPELVQRIIKEHQEREDGSGYPEGLKGDAIHPLSKVMAVANCYDELVHMLRDIPSMLPTNAMRQLFLGAKKGQFHSKVVESFVALLGIYPVSTAVRLTNGEKGIVIEVPPDQHLSPVVEIKYSANGSPLNPPRVCNLAEEKEAGNGLEIEAVLDPSKPADDPNRLLDMDVA
jgi:HD-GYP domain-containing protein (c-di-GMP phosphodiesterase class II)